MWGISMTCSRWGTVQCTTGNALIRHNKVRSACTGSSSRGASRALLVLSENEGLQRTCAVRDHE